VKLEGGQVVQFIMSVKAITASEAGAMPDDTLIAARTKYNEGMAKAGILLDLAGLRPSSKGARQILRPAPVWPELARYLGGELERCSTSGWA
jgi:hypothetical protein